MAAPVTIKSQFKPEINRTTYHAHNSALCDEQ
jgi:hypothetical protein